MKNWFDTSRFLWEEEIAPTEKAPRLEHKEPAGVSRPLEGALRLVLLGGVATGLMSQIIGVRLIASVDAAPSYTDRCIQLNCLSLQGAARTACYRSCVTDTP